MKARTIIVGMLCCLLLCTAILSAQDEKMRTRKNPNALKEIKIDDFAWMMGLWQGEALGGIVEEFWGPPRAGTMPGVFRLATDKGVSFYEFFVLGEQNGVFMLRLKHFTPEVHGWEAKNQTVDFEYLDRGPAIFYFNGLTIERDTEHEMTVYVKIQTKNGSTIVPFKYYKVN